MTKPTLNSDVLPEEENPYDSLLSSLLEFGLDIVHDAGAGIDRAEGHRGLPGIDRDERATDLARQALDHGQHSSHLLVGGHGLGAGSRTLASDVDETLGGNADLRFI